MARPSGHPVDDDREVIGESGGKLFRQLSEEQIADARELLEWSRSLDDCHRQFAEWQAYKYIAEARQKKMIIQMNLAQAQALWHLFWHRDVEGLRSGEIVNILDQDNYGSVIIETERGYRWKLPRGGGSSLLGPTPAPLRSAPSAVEPVPDDDGDPY